MTDFSSEQIAQLEQELDPRLVSERKGGGNTVLKYIEGHDAIDQANRIFGYGAWSYRPLICEQKVLTDPLTGEAVGITYKAQVELVVRGCAPIVEVGSQPVAAWNVRDVVISRRKKGDTSDIQEWETVNARRTIVDAHEMAEKGAVTDALKRALRTFGNQFGNGLYGDGRVDLSVEEVTPSMVADLRAYVGKIFSFKDADFEQRWSACKVHVLGRPKADPDLNTADITKIRTYAANKAPVVSGVGGGR